MNTPPEPVIVIGGGQSGLAAACAARDVGLTPVVLEAGSRPAGSWPHYYESLTLFSPAEYSSFPDFPFDGDPDRYPTRDEVAGYLTRYADKLDVDIRTGTRAVDVEQDGQRFVVHTSTGDAIAASGVVAASGSFSRPHRPELPGSDGFTGDVLHVADYRRPDPYRGRRVVVVGGGNSAIQVAHELAHTASVTLASRTPLHFTDQRKLGRDLHYWLKVTRLDMLPPAWLERLFPHRLVIDTGGYRHAIESGMIDRRPMFSSLYGDSVVWSDGTREQVDAIILATGYLPSLGYLDGLGALDERGMPHHIAGISTTHPGLVYLGLEFQRSFSSNTLRGVHRDAAYVMDPLAAHASQISAGPIVT
ncbi:flavin-containing monooxygenase [Phytoactinopolyspora halotolerans]|uniref:NAD(P)/FAD-dependent oxidoreductase n=1 Tax=Phytoactinopolyspora halotolerans TaxID=1981512 RepID=A0A6L9SC06_9ACTN|nr:NAD(P)-binding domain-containing protein [Phytoactinopolyspora halotolerans]NEE02895.1 NAD(P)/FAD-dependent oxidoreductase [Phytoactinopolyspora halotolerans]